MGPGSIWTPTVIWSGSSDTLLTSHWVLSQIYIDDTQAYLHCAHCAAAAAVRSMQGAMDVLALWMSSNRLRLNASKTLFIWFSTRQQLAKLDFGALAADAEFPFLAFSTTVRDLDQELFVTSPYRAGPLLLLLPAPSTQSGLALADLSRCSNSHPHIRLISRMDGCLSIYAGLPLVRIDRLERVHQAAACRLIWGFTKTDRVSHYNARGPALTLPSQCIYFRISSLGEPPAYQRELSPRLVPGRVLSSSLSCPRRPGWCFCQYIHIATTHFLL